MFAVVTDSSFVDGGQIIVAQAAQMLRLPTAAFWMTGWFMRRFTGVAPLDLSDEQTVFAPMLHVHGTGDTAVNVGEVERLAGVTGGVAWRVVDAGHVRSYERQPEVYLATVTDFIDHALSEKQSALN